MGFRVTIAATKEDWLSELRQTSGYDLIAFYRFGMGMEAVPEKIALEEMPDLGVSRTGILVQEIAFLAVPADRRLEVRAISQQDGSLHFALDQLANLDSFVLRPGGLYGEGYFIVGELASLYDTGVAPGFGMRFAARVRRHFRPAKSLDAVAIWVGPDCLRRYYGSRVFTQDYRTPPAAIDLLPSI